MNAKHIIGDKNSGRQFTLEVVESDADVRITISATAGGKDIAAPAAVILEALKPYESENRRILFLNGEWVGIYRRQADGTFLNSRIHRSLFREDEV
ncbi:MAG TPA: hypothetical protein VH595_03125 [Verrucomicrobiae bacterium]|jgi:hypothetical protein|nr:hypothetical protein [Verrucomicrobiae bacterium]